MNADLHAMLREGRWVQPLSAAGVLGIGAAAFLLSYDALHSLAVASGVRPGLARIWPGVLDGFIVVATLTVVAAKRARQPTRPAAPWPRPSALGLPTPAASPPATRRHAPLRRVARRQYQPDVVRTASAMPEPPAAASRARRPSPPRTSPVPDSPDRNRLPAAPLLHAIQQRARLRHQSLRELLGPELFGAYGNAQAAGTISLVTLERFCDEVLGWHPRMLYGEAYDQASVASHP